MGCYNIFYMNLSKTLQTFYLINDYVLLKLSKYDSSIDEITLKQEYVKDLAKFNNIIGRLELYLKDKKDKENSIYMIEWFKKEMEERDYMYEDFIEWAEERLTKND